MRTRIRVIAFLAAVAAAAFGASPSAAQSPQSYPYCAIDASLGATSCYYSSREQCGSRCFETRPIRARRARWRARSRRHAAPRR